MYTCVESLLLLSSLFPIADGALFICLSVATFLQVGVAYVCPVGLHQLYASFHSFFFLLVGHLSATGEWQCYTILTRLFKYYCLDTTHNLY